MPQAKISWPDIRHYLDEIEDSLARATGELDALRKQFDPFCEYTITIGHPDIEFEYVNPNPKPLTEEEPW